MAESMDPLASQIITFKRWRWVAGMRYRLHSSHPWLRYDGEDCFDDDGNLVPQSPPSLQSVISHPDLSDPATIGCVLHLISEAWGDKHSYMGWDGKNWKVFARPVGHIVPVSVGSGITKAEALVAALKRAP